MKKITKNKIAFMGSFDPIHIGHIYIIQQMLNLDYDEYILIIANNWDKVQPDLTLRKAKAIKVLKEAGIDLEKLNVVTTDQEMTTYLKQNDIRTIIRGYRNEKDKVYEDYLYDIYKKDLPYLERILIKAPKQYENISSSSIKEPKQ